MCSESALVDTKGVLAHRTGVSDLLHTVDAVRNKTTAKDTSEDTAEEGEDVLSGTRLPGGVGGDLIVAPGAHHGHRLGSEALLRLSLNQKIPVCF